MSSLFKRVTLPLLAVAAAATLTSSLCGPTRAATAALDYCAANGPYEIDMRVKCSMTGDSTWNKALFQATSSTSNGSRLDDGFTIYGPGDYYRPHQPYYYAVGVSGSNTYTCWCECDGVQYDGTPWQAFTSKVSVTN